MVERASREFEGIRVATEDWPIVLIEFPAKRVADASLHAALDHLESLMNEAVRVREKIFIITDLTPMREITPASQRTYTGEWVKRTALLSKASSVGHATVTPSTILRGIITAVSWIHPSPNPAFSLSTRDEAMLKGIDLLRANHVPLPPRLVNYAEKRTASPGRAGRA